MGHFAQQAGATEAVFGGRAQQNAIQPADVASFENLQIAIAAFQLFEHLQIGRGGKHAWLVLGMHLRRHGGEREDALDAEFSRVFN